MTLTTTPTPHIAARPRNVALTAARVVAGVLGGFQLAGVSYFAFVAPEESIWLGWYIDVPVLTILFAALLAKLATAFAPGLTDERRIKLGLTAFGLGVAVTLTKVPLYDEPEGLTFLAADAVLLALLLLARRGRTG